MCVSPLFCFWLNILIFSQQKLQNLKPISLVSMINTSLHCWATLSIPPHVCINSTPHLPAYISTCVILEYWIKISHFPAVSCPLKFMNWGTFLATKSTACWTYCAILATVMTVSIYCILGIRVLVKYGVRGSTGSYFYISNRWSIVPVKFIAVAFNYLARIWLNDYF